MKTTTPCSLLFSVAVLLLPPPPSLMAQTVTYDPTTDFSITNGNPNGVWSYGSMPVGFGPLNLLSNTGLVAGEFPAWIGWNFDWAPLIWKNLRELYYEVPTGWLSLHPGPGEEPMVLRWTAQHPGPVTVEGGFLPGDVGTMQVGIRLNDQPWWDASDSGAFFLQTNVVAGSTIDFTVYGGYGWGNTPLTLLISEPSTFALHLARDGQTNILSFTAPTDGTYVMQFTDRLTPPIPWLGLTTNVLSANQSISFAEQSSSLRGFYRARRD